MFGLFKKKSELEILQNSFNTLMAEAYKLTSSTKSNSHQKYVEADNILKKTAILQDKF